MAARIALQTHALRTLLAATAALLASAGEAAALDLSPLTEVYREDFVGETGLPFTPELGTNGLLAAASNPPGFEPTYDGTNAQFSLPAGVSAIALVGGRGTPPAETGLVTGNVALRGNFASLSAPSGGPASAFVEAQFLSPSCSSTPCIAINTSIEVTEGGGAADTAELTVCEFDAQGLCTSPTTSLALSTAAASAILGGAAFELDLVVDRTSSVAVSSIDISGVGAFSTSLVLASLATQPFVLTLVGITRTSGLVTADLVDFSIFHDIGCVDSVVVPNASSWLEGPDANVIPFSVPSFLGSVRAQQVFAASEFDCAGSRRFINSIALRPDALTGPNSWTIPEIEIRLSTTSRAPDGLSATFADNVDGYERLVYSGPLPLSTAAGGPAAGAKDFDIVIPFDTPFPYDPAKGNLLLDVRTITPGAITGSAAPDAINVSSDGVSRVTSLFGGVDNATGITDSVGLVVRFDLDPPKVPALGPPGWLALAGAIGGLGFAGLRRRRR